MGSHSKARRAFLRRGDLAWAIRVQGWLRKVSSWNKRVWLAWKIRTPHREVGLTHGVSEPKQDEGGISGERWPSNGTSQPKWGYKSVHTGTQLSIQNQT